MDALHISGKWYISSRRAAKEHGYHSDYIGQLIRSGKVKGQKVGRSWYVLSDSLSEYLEKEAKDTGKTAAKEKISIKENTPEPAVPEEVRHEEEQEAAPEIAAEEPAATVPVGEVAAAVEAPQSVNVEPARIRLVPPDSPVPARKLASRKEPPLMTYLRDEESLYPQVAAHKAETVLETDLGHSVPIQVTSVAEPAAAAMPAQASSYSPPSQPRTQGGARRIVILLLLAAAVTAATVAASALLSTNISVSL